MMRLHQPMPAESAQAARQREAVRVEAVRQQARDLIRTTQTQLSTSVHDGRMTAVEVIKGDAFLDRFARKMGL